MAAGVTYTPIATTTLGSAQTSYTFSSISGSYTDLVLVYQTRASSQNVYIDVVCQVNGDTGTNYSFTYMSGDGGTALKAKATNVNRMIVDVNGAPWNAYWAAGRLNFLNYSNTATYKSVISRTDNPGGTSGGTDFVINMWRSTSAINSIKIYLDGGYSMDTGTVLSLYGIAAA